MREYLAIEAVNAGLLHTIDTRCARAAWHDSWLNPGRPIATSTAAQGTGTIAHQALLEGSMDCVAVINPQQHPNKGDGAIPTGWTNPAMRAARDAAIVAGKVPLLPDEVAPIEAMVSAAREYIDSLRESQPAVWAMFQPGGGESETTLVWKERDGTLCRIRPDRLSSDRGVMGDYKTTKASADPDTWFRRQAGPLGYPISAAFYRRGGKAIFGAEPAYVWLVQEQDAPYLCSLVSLDSPGHAIASRKCHRALQTWAAAVASGRWNGYMADVAYPTTPSWEIAREEEQGGDFGSANDQLVDDMPETRAA
jgi:hypothetical protein